MSLAFPNPSRSYDPRMRRIHFWGHDGAMEVPFFLQEDAIFVIYPRTRNTEEAVLAAFDLARETIFAAAAKVYAPGRHRSFYTLTADQFSRSAAG